MQFENSSNRVRAAGAPPAGSACRRRRCGGEAKGDWQTAAHRCCQDSHDERAWAHAYLHRVVATSATCRGLGSGHLRAGKTPSAALLEQEWEEIAKVVLS